MNKPIATNENSNAPELPSGARSRPRGPTISLADLLAAAVSGHRPGADKNEVGTVTALPVVQIGSVLVVLCPQVEPSSLTTEMFTVATEPEVLLERLKRRRSALTFRKFALTIPVPENLPAVTDDLGNQAARDERLALSDTVLARFSLKGWTARENSGTGENRSSASSGKVD